MKKYFELIRIKHWLKNFLIFIPIFFSKNLLDISLLLKLLIAFIIFSLIASIVYIINDIKDINLDKMHPKKSKRPLAAGKISIRNAINIILILFAVSCLLSVYLYKNISNLCVIFIPFAYLLLNCAYSFKLKDVPILDVAILVSGNLWWNSCKYINFFMAIFNDNVWCILFRIWKKKE